MTAAVRDVNPLNFNTEGGNSEPETVSLLGLHGFGVGVTIKRIVSEVKVDQQQV